ncbi:Uu.00g021710.m01.CDS01 [Anthostomella pinea]|uniref:Uu.00g021710.m01.CDS01 n=1 Tax=Anthostomella pinea TaxID=933095 RepID=A0AAI8VZQ4_9PEZI|nr:Uu.00g021710.m01.CDS01 [Anthostomella pinea]
MTAVLFTASSKSCVSLATKGQEITYDAPYTDGYQQGYPDWVALSYTYPTSNSVIDPYLVYGYPVRGYNFGASNPTASITSGPTANTATASASATCDAETAHAPASISKGSIAGAAVGGVLGFAGLLALGAAVVINRKARRMMAENNPTVAPHQDQPMSERFSEAYTSQHMSQQYPSQFPSPLSSQGPTVFNGYKEQHQHELPATTEVSEVR